MTMAIRFSRKPDRVPPPETDSDAVRRIGSGARHLAGAQPAKGTPVETYLYRAASPFRRRPRSGSMPG